MDFFYNIFHYICGQGHCFVIDSQALPVCQRCLGLYAGAALTGIWLLSRRRWHLGLPCLVVCLVHIVLLLTAMLSGVHIIDFGPIWRLICGLWTGHVVLMWLTGAVAQFNLLLGCRPEALTPWRMRDKTEAIICVVMVTAIALVFHEITWLGWYFWTAVVVVGILFLSSILLLTTVVFILWLISPVVTLFHVIQGKS